jgi:3-hydroxybutyryl-CoA dehydrogenase
MLDTPYLVPHTSTLTGVAVIGAGTMGNGIAHVFAQAGFDVTLIDINAGKLEKAIQNISKNLDRQLLKGTLTRIKNQRAFQKLPHWQTWPVV